jgi:hypothetical protein
VNIPILLQGIYQKIVKGIKVILSIIVKDVMIVIEKKGEPMNKLQEIKNRVENQMIFLEGHKDDIHFEAEVDWLINRVEELEMENEKLKKKIEWVL